MASGLSRRSSQRLARKVRIRSELRESISALNWMYCGAFDAQPPFHGGALHDEVLDRLGTLVHKACDLGDQSCMPSGGSLV